MDKFVIDPTKYWVPQISKLQYIKIIYRNTVIDRSVLPF